MFENERFNKIIEQLSRISNSLKRIADRLDSWDGYTSYDTLNYLKTKNE